MKFKIALISMLLVLSCQSFAKNTNDWVYESITGDLKQTPGCKDKAVAAKKASSGLRFKKYAKLLCGSKGYGWAIDKVTDKGTLVCEACEGEYEGEEKYRCHMQDVVVLCKQVARGF
jgi:hypothetical protein